MLNKSVGLIITGDKFCPVREYKRLFKLYTKSIRNLFEFRQI